MKNQKGFGLIEALLIMVIVGIIGAAGYYVYSANKQQPEVSNSSIQKSGDDTVKTEEDETSGWLEVESVNDEFSLRVPDGWNLNNDPTRDLIISGLDADDVTYLEGTDPVITTEETPVSDAPHRFSAAVYDEAIDMQGTETKFTLSNGIKGAKYYEKAEDLVNGSGPLKSSTYVFEKNDKFYIVNYSIMNGDPDNTEIVEKVIKTLQF